MGQFIRGDGQLGFNCVEHSWHRRLRAAGWQAEAQVCARYAYPLLISVYTRGDAAYIFVHACKWHKWA
jgi:hypothetical protein